MDEQKTCIDCGADFEMRPGEVKFYDANALPHPRRCKSCRAARRAWREQADAIDTFRNAPSAKW